MNATDEILAVLVAMERGDVTFLMDVITHRDGSAMADPWGGQFPSITYRTTSGWVFKVFNDAGCWDYIDSVIAPDGLRWMYCSTDDPEAETWVQLPKRVVNWRPPATIVCGESHSGWSDVPFGRWRPVSEDWIGRWPGERGGASGTRT